MDYSHIFPGQENVLPDAVRRQIDEIMQYAEGSDFPFNRNIQDTLTLKDAAGNWTSVKVAMVVNIDLLSDEVKKTPSSTKPPLGLRPIKFWKEERLIDVTTAIANYMQAGKSLPIEWVTQYNALQGEIGKM